MKNNKGKGRCSQSRRTQPHSFDAPGSARPRHAQRVKFPHSSPRPPFTPNREAALLAAQINVDVLVVAATAAAVQAQQVANFATAAGSEAQAMAITIGATEEEAAQAAQAVARAALEAAKAAIAEADATTSTT